MSAIFIINIIILNIVIWLLLSYFWSYWTYKLFKPWQWLEGTKQKVINKKLLKQEKRFKDKNKFYFIWFQLLRIKENGIDGAMAEFGVYKGETAKIIHNILPERKLYLLDDFTGIPKQVIKEDCDGTLRPQTIQSSNTNKDVVLNYIKGNNNIIIKEGVFEESIKEIEEESFAFVHLDVNLYQATYDGLIYFYPRLAEGGIILVQDYNHTWEGVKEAVNQFEKEISEQFIAINDMYGSVILVKNKS